jgi:FMN phosphatase YigB (HAD superfamily)
MNKPRAVCLDVDGTLCDVTSIRHHVLSRKKNYDAFHYLSAYCPPIDWVADLAVEARDDGLVVIVVTARMEKWRLLTENWLEHNDIPYAELHMRADGDIRKDRAVKEEILAALQERYHIIWAVDDNPSILEMWRDHGILAVEVPGWAEEEKEAVASNAQ